LKRITKSVSQFYETDYVIRFKQKIAMHGKYV